MSFEAIGRNAARLWHMMNDGTMWCYNRIRQESKLSDRDINAAIGWLAREDTIEVILDPVSNMESYKVRQFWDVAGFVP